MNTSLALPLILYARVKYLSILCIATSAISYKASTRYIILHGPCLWLGYHTNLTLNQDVCLGTCVCVCVCVCVCLCVYVSNCFGRGMADSGLKSLLSFLLSRTETSCHVSETPSATHTHTHTHTP